VLQVVPFTNLLKGLRQLVVLLQKVIGYPYELFVYGIRELHATPSMSATYRWENFILNQQKDGQITKSFYHPRSIYCMVHIKPYATRLLLGRSNLVRRYLQSRVADPDPDWIRIQSGQWIRIRIRNPDLGGQK
jgi:hypothetical protein